MLLKILELIKKIQEDIGNDARVQFSVHDDCLRIQTWWEKESLRYRYQFPDLDLVRLEGEEGEEEAEKMLISMFVGLCKKGFMDALEEKNGNGNPM